MFFLCDTVKNAPKILLIKEKLCREKSSVTETGLLPQGKIRVMLNVVFITFVCDVIYCYV